MSGLGLTALVIIGCFGIGAWVIIYYLRKRFKKWFPSKEDRDQIKIMHQALVTAGFFGEASEKGELIYISNTFLSKLIEDAYEDGTLRKYMDQHNLRISSIDRKEISHHWILCSHSHCVGFDMP